MLHQPLATKSMSTKNTISWIHRRFHFWHFDLKFIYKNYILYHLYWLGIQKLPLDPLLILKYIWNSLTGLTSYFHLKSKPTMPLVKHINVIHYVLGLYGFDLCGSPFMRYLEMLHILALCSNFLTLCGFWSKF